MKQEFIQLQNKDTTKTSWGHQEACGLHAVRTIYFISTRNFRVFVINDPNWPSPGRVQGSLGYYGKEGKKLVLTLSQPWRLYQGYWLWGVCQSGLNKNLFKRK